jgi:hypothetical protein
VDVLFQLDDGIFVDTPPCTGTQDSKRGENGGKTINWSRKSTLLLHTYIIPGLNHSFNLEKSMWGM